MTRAVLIAFGALITLTTTRIASAWDGYNNWCDPASGKTAGGGGIIATGGARDYKITCAHCHIKAEGKIDAKIDFTPPLPKIGDQESYEPGQPYQVSVTLLGEHLGLTGCDQYANNQNNFAASIENASGEVAGTIASDSGQTSASCPQTLASKPTGTTAMCGRCEAIFSVDSDAATSWSFSWTAPPAGSGPLTLYYGVTDGNCMMDSMDDDTKVGTVKLGEATASLAPPKPGRGGSAFACLFLPAAVGLALARRRRQAGGRSGAE